MLVVLADIHFTSVRKTVFSVVLQYLHGEGRCTCCSNSPTTSSQEGVLMSA